MSEPLRRVLAAGGLEPSGRAGLLVDLEALRLSGVHGLGVATALTAQGTTTFAVEPVPPWVLERQIEAVFEQGPVHAVKLGLVPSREILDTLVRTLGGRGLPWVVDPVVRTSEGRGLSSLQPADFLALAGEHVVLTPNVPELAWLTGTAEPLASLREVEGVGKTLVARGFGAVVIKGGHLPEGEPATDVVYTARGRTLLPGGRLARKAHHRGTGCRFASTLAAALAAGESVEEAAQKAQAAVRTFLQS